MSYVALSIAASAALFIGMVAMLLLGRRIGRKRLHRDPEGASNGLGVIDAAVFGLFGLLIAFTFSGASSRFDERRQLIVQEANDIGTAWLRLDLLPPEHQPALRQMFRDYADARIAAASAGPDLATALAQVDRAAALQVEIWAAAVTSLQTPGLSPAATSVLVPALNAMFDITTTRAMAAKRHPPPAIWVLFCLIGMAAALFAGQSMSSSRTLSIAHLLGFPAMMASVVALVINLEHPRLGLITLEEFDQAIVAVRAGMD